MAGLLGLQGCAAAALSMLGMAGSAGLDHTLDGISYKTFAAPVAGVRLAVLRSFKRMQIRVVKDSEHESDPRLWSIIGRAADREIDVEVERLTGRAASMRVVVQKGKFFFKDSATGEQIIVETSEELQRLNARRIRVASAQFLLQRLGYKPGAADGLSGARTRSAIRKFQRRQRLIADGRVTTGLVSRLERRVDVISERRRKAMERRKRRMIDRQQEFMND
jgi:hypothetical protein